MKTEIKVMKADFSQILRRYIARQVHFNLSHFGNRVGPLDIRVLGNQEFPGDGTRCCITAEIAPLGRVNVEESGPDLYTAVEKAITEMRLAVAYELERFRDMDTAARNDSNDRNPPQLFVVTKPESKEKR